MKSAESKTAKIYSFPSRGNSKMSARLARLEEEARQYPRTTFGSGWYHDDAILEANDTHRQ